MTIGSTLSQDKDTLQVALRIPENSPPPVRKVRWFLGRHGCAELASIASRLSHDELCNLRRSLLPSLWGTQQAEIVAQVCAHISEVSSMLFDGVDLVPSLAFCRNLRNAPIPPRVPPSDPTGQLLDDIHNRLLRAIGPRDKIMVAELEKIMTQSTRQVELNALGSPGRVVIQDFESGGGTVPNGAML